MQWRRSPHALWRTAPGYLALSTVEGRTAEVRGPGWDVWTMLVDWIDERELIVEVARRYATSPETVGADVERLLVRLDEEGYVDRRA